MLKKIEDMNYYELLEVNPRASAQEIHKAYERIRRVYDPNSIALYSLFSPEETEKIRQRIEEAYRTLIYDENRRTYDLSLHGVEVSAAPAAPPPRASVSSAVRKEAAAPARPEMPGLEPRPVPAAPPTPTVPVAVQPVPAEITEFTGSVLKMLREQRGLTIQNIADITKLGGRHLGHIEDEIYAKLPVRPYLRGFLVLYAKALGYEPDRIVADYLKRYDAAIVPAKK
jgi:curved DNA-binding protein CbpA